MTSKLDPRTKKKRETPAPFAIDDERTTQCDAFSAFPRPLQRLSKGSPPRILARAARRRPGRLRHWLHAGKYHARASPWLQRSLWNAPPIIASPPRRRFTFRVRISSRLLVISSFCSIRRFEDRIVGGDDVLLLVLSGFTMRAVGRWVLRAGDRSNFSRGFFRYFSRGCRG